MDVCALCHAGIGDALAPPLSFVAATYWQCPEISKLEPNAHLDVHGSQCSCWRGAGLSGERDDVHHLSRCHVTQRDLAGFASRCMSCHQVESCRTFPKLGHRSIFECVTCHMPLQETAQIVSAANGRSLRPR